MTTNTSFGLGLGNAEEQMHIQFVRELEAAFDALFPCPARRSAELDRTEKHRLGPASGSRNLTPHGSLTGTYASKETVDAFVSYFNELR